jgi:predicted ATP-grasp superfamily ATP-dependent carboligase
MNKKCIYVFGSKRKYTAFRRYFSEQEYEIFFISGESTPGNSKTKEELLSDFLLLYSESQEIVTFVSFGKGSVIGNIEAISEVCEEIKKNYPNCVNTEFIGPSLEAARIFCNKYFTYEALAKLKIPVPYTKEIIMQNESDISEDIGKNLSFPLIVKSENLSGGRGMYFAEDNSKMLNCIKHLYQKGITKLILSEYVVGVEATFTVLRLGDTFVRLPASYKKETTQDMIHPDAKVKIAGIFQEFDSCFKMTEDVMKKYSIYGFFSLQGVLIKKNDSYEVSFLEAAPRMTGSTPIMEASLVDFNAFELIAKWITNRAIEFAHKRRLAVQYSTYIHDGLNTVNELKENIGIVEAKYENLGEVQYSEDYKTRIRISFFADNDSDLEFKLKQISAISNNSKYGKDIKETLAWFKRNHPGIYFKKDYKVLEGVWGDDVKWEFCLSAYLPDKNLCSAVFGLPKKDQSIVLTETHRGLELPGGHIEKNESIPDALKRELLEEAGFVAQRFMPFGYRKITALKKTYDSNGNAYPYPISYIPHFLVTGDYVLKKPTGKEVVGRSVLYAKSTRVCKSHVGDIIKIGSKELKRIA